MTEDTVFHPAYALGVRDALVRGVARTRGTIAPALRLLVPVDVRALVVRPGHAGGAADHVPIADVTTLALNTDTFKGPASTPPFTDLATPGRRACTCTGHCLTGSRRPGPTARTGRCRIAGW